MWRGPGVHRGRPEEVRDLLASQARERGQSLQGFLLAILSGLGVDTVPVDDLLPRMWQLKANISAYDAAYVALAERRGLTLVTSDGRLARASTAYCRVELVA